MDVVAKIDGMIKDMEIITRITNVKDALIDLFKSVKVKYVETNEDDDGNQYEVYKLIIDDDETKAYYYKDKRLLKIGFYFSYNMRMSYHMLKLINAYFISRGYKLFGNDVDKIIWRFYEGENWDDQYITFERATEFEED